MALQCGAEDEDPDQQSGGRDEQAAAQAAPLLERIGREIYDVLRNACDLARLTGIDVVQAAADKRDLNASRGWPESG